MESRRPEDVANLATADAVSPVKRSRVEPADVSGITAKPQHVLHDCVAELMTANSDVNILEEPHGLHEPLAK